MADRDRTHEELLGDNEGLRREITALLTENHTLRQRAQELAVIFRSIGDGVITTDASLCITRMNPVAQHLTGWDEEDALGRHLDQVFTVVDETTGAPVSAPAASGVTPDLLARHTGEAVLMRRDGSPLPVARNSTPIVTAKGPGGGLVLAFRDQSRERSAREALRKSEDMLKTSQRLSRIGGWEYDLPANAINWTEETFRIHDMDPATAGAMDPDERIRQSLACYDESCQLAVMEAFKRCVETGESYEMEVPFTTVKGRRLWLRTQASAVMHNGRVVKVTGYLADITQQRAMMDTLRKNEERFRLMVKNSSDILMILDADTTQRYVSEAARRITGFLPEELEGRHLFALVHPDDLTQVKEAWDQAIAHPDQTVSIHYRHIHKNGGFVHLETVGQSFLHEPAVRGIIANVRDVTERMTLQQKEHLLQEQLQQSQKMESIGHLAGGVAHDFNNLLTVIRGYAEMSREELPEATAPRHYIEEIIKAAQSAASLTQQLLAYSRRQIINPRVIDLNLQIGRSRHMIERLIGEDITVVFFPESSPALVKMDPSQMDQVIMNLSVNARDAMPDGGSLTIETKTLTLDEKHCKACLEPMVGDFVMMAVTDTGVGMDEQIQGRIFEPFFTTKKRGEGTGLGLSTVMGIVHQNGGHINVYSEPGQGTTFRVYLPATREAAEETRRARDDETLIRGSETVLVVEDMEVLRRLAQKSLVRFGYQVIVACGGEDALAKAADHDFDLLLTDVVMPGLSGKDIYERLCPRMPHLKVLYMSGYTENTIAHHGILDRGTHFIQKPFRPRDLVGKVREVLDE